MDKPDVALVEYLDEIEAENKLIVKVEPYSEELHGKVQLVVTITPNGAARSVYVLLSELRPLLPQNNALVLRRAPKRADPDQP